jgi:tetratricopeptide (TPR) repeat protein
MGQKWKGEESDILEALLSMPLFQLEEVNTVRINPSPHHLCNLGDVLLARGNPEKAIAPLLEAVRLDPDHELAHYDLSRAYFDLGRYKEAAEEAVAALKTDPEMTTGRINLGINAMTNLGLSLMNQEKYEDAIRCFRRIEKEFAKTYFNLGLILFRTHRDKEALVYFKKAVEIEPDDPEYLNLIGQTYGELGNYKAAEKSLCRSLEIDSGDFRSFYDLGNLFLKIREKRKEAKRLLERAIEINPEYGPAYYCLCCWHALEGKKTKAIEFLEKAVEKGFKDRDWIEADKDLEGLRSDTRYRTMMKKLNP